MRDAARQGLAVGFFDGVHLGHQAILRGASAALTFRNHPLSVLSAANAPRLLMSFDERMDAIHACGVDDIVALDFTPELANMAAKEFFDKYLASAKKIYCGENWRFGRGGKGNAAFLLNLGVEVEIIPYAGHEGKRISSTRIREALERGECAAAKAMLGREYSVKGAVKTGKGEGKKLGFPTVNIVPYNPSVPLVYGVYEVEVDGEKAIANFGTAPTFADHAWENAVIELHFPEERSAGNEVTVAFKRFIRPERNFATTDELRAQIAADCEEVFYGRK